MCWFRKKKKAAEPIDSKYYIGESVRFRYRDDLRPGYVYSVRKDSDGNVIYGIQVGGECPVVIDNVKEEDIKWPIK